MAARRRNVLLMVSNYPRETGYAWWLMRAFWSELEGAVDTVGGEWLRLYPDGVESSRHGFQPTHELAGEGQSIWYWARILRYCLTTKIRAIYFTDRKYFDPKYLVLRMLGVRYIVTHDHTPGDRPYIGGFKGFVKALRNRLPLVTADLVVAISPMMRQRQLQNARIPGRKVTCVTNGVPVRAERLERRDAKRSIGLDQNRLVCVAVSRLDRYKRVDFILEVFSSVIKSGSDAVLLVVGDGPERHRLENRACELGILEYVHFVGIVPDARPYLDASDVFIHSSRGEGMSLAILEAMESQCAVLVPNIPSVCQAITNGVSGFLYADSNTNAASERLELLLRDSELRKSLAEQARQTVAEKFSIVRCMSDFRYSVVDAIQSTVR